MKKLSLVVSVYNEEAVLNKFFTAIEEYKSNIAWDLELIFVDDGSVDDSYPLLKAFAESNDYCKVIHFSRNFGHEAAMIAGIDHARGDGIICMDADLQHPLECIPSIIDQFEEGYEVITMVRSSNASAGIIRNITSKLFYKVINCLTSDFHFEENASDYFAISSRVAKVLKSEYREKTRFLRGYIQSVGFKKTKIEYVAASRAGGESHYSLSKLLTISLNSIISFSNMPLKLGIFAATGSSLLGLITLIYTLFTYQDAPSGYATIVVLICFLFAVMFLVIGIIGQYIAVLFSEIKNRPIYIIEDKINFNKNTARIPLSSAGSGMNCKQ